MRIAKSFSIFLLVFLIGAAPLFSASKKEPVFILGDMIWRIKKSGSYSDYLKFLRRQGYTETSVEIADPAGNFYFYSPMLEKWRWNQQSDLLIDYLNETLHEEGVAKPLSISLDFSALSRMIYGPETDRLHRRMKDVSTKDLAQFVLDLQEYYSFSNLAYEPFSQEVQSLFFLNLDPKREMSMMVNSPAIENYFTGNGSSDRWQISAPHKFVVQDLYPYPLTTDPSSFSPSIGLGDLIFALGNGLDREVFAGTALQSGFHDHAEHNLLLYRAAQYSPAGYFLRSSSENSYLFDEKQFDFSKAIKKDLLEFTHLNQSKEPPKRPVANLVLSSQMDSHLAMGDFIEPVMNALLANGYEVRVTFGQLADGAELYYVMNCDEWLSNLPFFNQLMTLMTFRKSHFYGTVIVHPLGEILDKGAWKTFREFFHIPATEHGWLHTMPETVEERGREIFWRGTVGRKNRGMTFIRENQVRQEGGETVLSDVMENETLSLILKSGNHYLINGNCLHLQAGYFLSRLMGDALKSPSLAYVTARKDFVAALAIDSTKVKIKVPAAEVAPRWRIVHFDQNGDRLRDEIINGQETFELTMSPYELILLLAEKHP